MDREKQELTPLYTALNEYRKESIVHFDVPGHKKNSSTPIAKAFGKSIIQMDANSTKELDMLSSPAGVILEAEKLMADAYSADNAFLLVNGSTFGIIVMILTVCSPKDKIILPRNVHKSAINGVILSGATPVFLSPTIDYNYGISNGISVKSLRKALKENPDAKAMFLINPTYFGVTSNLKEIIKLCHRHGVAVIVDEAHGAHFPFHKSFPYSGMFLGADMATTSVHKTGGSLTQSSVLLHNNGLISADKIRASINLLQTTSASYLLMSSLDIARAHLATKGTHIYGHLLKHIQAAKDELNMVEGISVYTRDLLDGEGSFDFDETKIIIKVNELGLTGFEVYEIMKKDYNIQLELAESYVVLAIVGIGDTKDTIRILVEAFKDLSRRFHKNKPFITKIAKFFEKPQTVVLPREAYYSAKHLVPFDDSLGKICAESVMIYPPGIPLIIPGELITKQVIKSYNFYLQQNCLIMNDYSGHVKVLGEEI